MCYRPDSVRIGVLNKIRSKRFRDRSNRIRDDDQSVDRNTTRQTIADKKTDRDSDADAKTDPNE